MYSHRGANRRTLSVRGITAIHRPSLNGGRNGEPYVTYSETGSVSGAVLVPAQVTFENGRVTTVTYVDPGRYTTIFVDDVPITARTW